MEIPILFFFLNFTSFHFHVWSRVPCFSSMSSMFSAHTCVLHPRVLPSRVSCPRVTELAPQLFFLFLLVWNFTFMCRRVSRVFRSRVLCLLITCFPVTRSPAMSQKFPSFSLTLWDFVVPCGHVFRVFRPRVLCLLVMCFPVTRSPVACSPVTCSLAFSHGNSRFFFFLF